MEELGGAASGFSFEQFARFDADEATKKLRLLLKVSRGHARVSQEHPTGASRDPKRLKFVPVRV